MNFISICRYPGMKRHLYTKLICNFSIYVKRPPPQKKQNKTKQKIPQKTKTKQKQIKKNKSILLDHMNLEFELNVQTFSLLG